jgi:DNA repair ATPase RecN
MSQGRTTISVQEISGEARVEELATMLGGATEKNLDSARDLLDQINKVIN